MANISHPENFGDDDLRAHVETYHSFLRVIRWTVLVVVLALLFLAAWGG